MDEKDTNFRLSQEEEKKIMTFASAFASVFASVSKTEEKQKSFIDSLKHPTVLAAIFVGVLGIIINNQYQSGQKEREFQLEMVKTQRGHDLLSHQEQIKQQKEVISNLHNLIGRCVGASDELITLTKPDFNPAKYDGSVENQRKSIVEYYNECERKWREEKNKIKWLIDINYSGRQDVTNSWGETERAVCDYLKCSRKWYLEHINKYTEEASNCIEIKSTIDDKIKVLNERLSFTQSGDYRWKNGSTFVEPFKLPYQVSAKH